MLAQLQSSLSGAYVPTAAVLDLWIQFAVFLCLVAGIVAFAIPSRLRGAQAGFALIATSANLAITIVLFRVGGEPHSLVRPWTSLGLEYALRLDAFSRFILLSTAAFGFLVALYSAVFMRHQPRANQFWAYLLLTLGLTNGAVLADNLILLLFFWESLLLPLFGMIAIGHKGAFKTAVKMFVIVGITDLCLMFGAVLAGHLAGTWRMSAIHLPLDAMGSVAFTFLIIGATSKAGSMPFHSWIPDAALDAPLPFMALLPAALEKLLGIYLLARICLDLFLFTAASWVSMMLMIVGAATILLAVMMALVQKDYKKLLSYHAISQVGYMILGIGTAVPVGIVGGLFHMLNNALYKSCLFLTGGAVEKQTGTTDLSRLGGLASKMPVTFACFVVAAVSISGVPPFNGFFSKEMVYDGAIERGRVFYLAALLGSFFTAASFLKLGHAAFLGKKGEASRNGREVPWPMLLPMIVLAAACVLFGVRNALPLRALIQPVLGPERLEGHDFSGLPTKATLVIATVVVLAAAIVNHLFGVRRSGSGLGAADHIHHAPVLSGIYDRAEKRYFDPYDIGLKVTKALSMIGWLADRFVDWIYNCAAAGIGYFLSFSVRKMHTGNYSTYIVWCLVGIALVLTAMTR